MRKGLTLVERARSLKSIFDTTNYWPTKAYDLCSGRKPGTQKTFPKNKMMSPQGRTLRHKA